MSVAEESKPTTKPSRRPSDITDCARLVRTKSCQLADILAMIGGSLNEDSNAIHRLPGALGAALHLADSLADQSIEMAHLVGVPSIDEEGLE